MQSEMADEQILLRQYGTGDVDALFHAARESIDEVGRWLPWCHAQYTRQESASWIQSRAEVLQAGTEYSFAIIERSGGQMVGGCGLNQIDRPSRRANLGYWIRTSATGRGYATRAARLLARFGFEQLELERIEIVAALGNHASQRVAEKVGATREGIARGRIRIGQVQHDAVVFSLVRTDAF